MKKVWIFLTVFLVILIVLGLGTVFLVKTKTAKKIQNLPIKITIVPGKTIKDVSGVVSSAWIFGRTDFLEASLKLSQNILSKFDFLKDSPKDASLEGYLFPDTYFASSSQSIEDFQIQVLSNFDKKLNQDLRSQIKKQNKTIFQVITMASILEKEVKTQDDKKIVAGILWKRVANNLPLQVDSTLLYFRISSHPDVLEKDVDSPYNTYKYAGLPVGPICSPSLESIDAAIYPTNTNYWFYLSAPDGKTIYAKTLGQHLINKAKYLSN